METITTNKKKRGWLTKGSRFGDPEKFCVKRIKYFQSDKAKSKKKRSERKYFYYGKSLKRIIKGICEQPEIHKHNRHNEQHEGIVQ